MIDVLLTDDHALVRTGIRRLLEDSGEVRIAGEANSGEEGVELAHKLALDPDARASQLTADAPDIFGGCCLVSADSVERSGGSGPVPGLAFLS